ncbi:hypothetical protein C8N46_101206 [Kordia periserrulae]|uniref:Uncharacterized protein n=1 Tax=Kordia periserrulae TaxID=701523 RepID=A0A2T6C5P0_9FLAO|nr:hypothetical protein [Kordia periserrulae]PTX63605.1 hypothetical protein C8N46_101206 [Kordia periserrulae]
MRMFGVGWFLGDVFDFLFMDDLTKRIREQQKQIDLIQSKLEKAEQNGFTKDSQQDILAQSKSLLNG